jgi:D-tagatose-1,6-bisphosphate aldolase subunit GatZ/KbaZ
VRDHFAILKAGPWLTFAFREAVFALATIEEELLSQHKTIVLSRVREALENAMLGDPQYWKNYYRGDEAALHFARKYSLSDRSRYYWSEPTVTSAVQRLISNLTEYPAPMSLLSQYLPNESNALREGTLANRPADLFRHKIGEVVAHYAFACGLASRAPDS